MTSCYVIELGLINIYLRGLRARTCRGGGHTLDGQWTRVCRLITQRILQQATYRRHGVSPPVRGTERFGT